MKREQIEEACKALGLDPDRVETIIMTAGFVEVMTWDGKFPIVPKREVWRIEE